MLFYFFKSCKTIFSTNRWDYSPYTEAGVKAYQKRHGLVQDGWAGCITTKYMKLECADHNCDKSAPAPDSKVDSSYLQLAGTVNQTMKNHRFS